MPKDILVNPTNKLSKILKKASNGQFRLEKSENLKFIAESIFGISFTKDTFSFQIK